MRRAVVGLLAPVDAGKTTLAEALLFEAGAIRSRGRVDHGDCFLDFEPVERERGITVFSKQARLEVEGVSLTLLDAPGHVDFSAEAERTLSVLDLAVLVVGATDGIGGHALTLWRLLERYQVPVVVFVNKCDLDGADPEALVDKMGRRLSEGCFLWERRDEEEVQEALATSDEEALETYLSEGFLTEETLVGLTLARKAHPCLAGAALRGEGVRELLDVLCALAIERTWPTELGARVYKVSHDERGERLVWLKVTGGTLHAKETVRCALAAGDATADKVDQLRIVSGARQRVVASVEAGEVCCATGLAALSAGDGIGFERPLEGPVLVPVLDFAVTSENTDAHALTERLSVLAEEEPTLAVAWDEELGEVRIRCMGVVQTEVIRELMKTRFSTDVSFGPGSVLYKETIAAPVRGIGHFEPLRHYAEVHLLLEPLERGSGMRYASAASTDELELRWQRLILTHLAEREHRGVLAGYGLTDCKITLLAGRAHPKHTEGGDFRQATYRAIRQALMQAQSILLEPIYAFELTVGAERVGRALADLARFSARFSAPEVADGVARITGLAPVSEISGYAVEVASYTAGQGSLSLTFAGYEEAHDAAEVIERRAYEPERDLAHTPDSVFCAHGAGYVVKWYEVADHAHLTP